MRGHQSEHSKDTMRARADKPCQKEVIAAAMNASDLDTPPLEAMLAHLEPGR